MQTKGHGMLLVAILSILASLPFSGLQAQGEAAHWYFGLQAGLDFGPSGAAPTVLLDGLTNTVEGTSSISDPFGNLLFYTDGQTVWNRNHLSMPAGTGLDGGASSSQAALIVRRPESETEYYIFTTYHMAGSPGLCYSIVDMNADGGMGDVTLKNQPLLDPSAEKITAAKHANNIDVWIIGHGWGDNSYHAWLLTESGLITTPVSTAAGAVHGTLPDNAIGYLRANVSSDRIAAAVYKQQIIEVLDFDRETGALSELVTIPQDDWVYGVEFSPDGSRLYATNQVLVPRLLQYSLDDPDPAAILASKTTVGVPSVPQPGGLAMASDGKLYMAAWNGFLSRVDDPNAAGIACGYVDNALNLAVGTAKLSMPNLPAYLFATNRILGDAMCAADTAFFSVEDPSDLDSVVWDFGDPGSGAAGFGSGTETYHLYSGPGTYTVTAILYGWGPTDTLSYEVSLMASPVVSLPSDTIICPGLGGLDIYPSVSGASSISWHDGSSTPVYTATGAGLIWLQASNACASAMDSLTVADGSLPLDLGEDIIACEQDEVLLDAWVDAGSSYLWSTGDSTSSITVDLPGTYSVFVTNSVTGCSSEDSVTVEFSGVIVDLGEDTVLPSGGSLWFDAGIPGGTYSWSTGESSPSIEVTAAGVYTVVVTDSNGCQGVASITVEMTSGIRDEFADGEFTLGPIPVGYTLNLNWRGSQPWSGLVSLRTADGRLVWQSREDFAPGGSIPIDFLHFSSGTYLLDLERDSGERMIKRVLRVE